MRAEARDLATGAAGESTVVATAWLEAVVEAATGSLQSLDADPAPPGLSDLSGTSVASRFRARVDAAMPELGGTGAPLYLLLDDLPGAALVSGYALLYGDALRASKGGAAIKVDICAGWAEGSSMVSAIRSSGQQVTPVGPPAPPIVDADDPDGWHALTWPGPHGTRRLRRIDVGPGRADGHCDVDAFFRDSHWDQDGDERVIHEYGIAAVVDPIAGRIVSLEAEAHVLPWVECPAAVASASRVEGRTFAELRRWVRKEMTGISTCTHLNDTLRSLTDLGTLLALRA